MTRQKKIAFLAKILPIAGLIVILPPLVSITNAKADFFGFPAIITYLFTIWIFLIVAAYLLQRKLPSHTPEQVEKQPHTAPSSKLNVTDHD